MDIHQMESLFNGQGLVFWAAVSAVALGLTLLSVSIAFQLRKVLGRYRLPNKWPRFKRSVAPAVPRVAVDGDTYRLGGAVAASAGSPTATVGVDPRRSEVLLRLRAAADSLDRIHLSLGRSGTTVGNGLESPLKSSGPDVDYIFRTNRA